MSGVLAWVQPFHGGKGAIWLVTVVTGLAVQGRVGGEYFSTIVQCAAIMDDFGELVMVEGWK